MDKIQEYRQKSAEALGLKIKSHGPKGTIVMLRSEETDDVYWYKDWQPDIDANQREMIEDWLIKQGCRIKYEYKKVANKWLVDIYNTYGDGIFQESSKSEAFRKAFMSYIEQNNEIPLGK